ncbi:MAG: hypothetical protein IIZ39_12290 [Blautia sp.]|nr:hypothetical protein [Blautia sp.]
METEHLGHKKGLRLLVCLLLAVLFVGVVSTPAQAAKKGWVKKSGKTYYYKNGKKVKGWKKIQGKYYYFGKKGVMQVNTIAGSEGEGFHYVDKKGIRCTDKTVELAKNLVLSLTKPSWSGVKKLQTCYFYLVRDCSYALDSYSFSPGSFPSMARNMFLRQAGDCYEGALCMAYVGKVLGFTSRMVMGYVDSNLSPSQVSSMAHVANNEHGWAEIMAEGTTYRVYDVSMARVYPPKLYHIPRAAYPYAIQATAGFKLNIVNGIVSWD